MTTASMEPTRVLIVEDNPSDVRLLRHAFKESTEWPVVIEHAADGDRAIARFQGDAPTPHLVILDLNLPKYHGAQVLKVIRSKHTSAAVPVAILSSTPRDAMVERVQREGVEADCYFSKPSGYEQLVQLIGCLRRCYEDAASRRAEGA
jgi:two-component system, chemotaxis family, response regulator Rcp1